MTKHSFCICLGVHYWYNIRGRDTPCETIFPVFLLYNGGVLNAFGWAMAIDLDAMSNRIENPPHSSYGVRVMCFDISFIMMIVLFLFQLHPRHISIYNCS